MTQQNAKEQLNSAAATIGVAAEIIRVNKPLIERYLAEAERMDSVGPILDPTLFNSSERRAVDAIMRPLFKASRDFLNTYDATVGAATQALAKVTR